MFSLEHLKPNYNGDFFSGNLIEVEMALALVNNHEKDIMG